MNLLAIETATDACSVALAVGEERLVDHRVAPREHARLVLPMTEKLLAEAGLARSALDGVAFGRGPGSFTGVRVAASVTQGIALGLDLGVVGVSTLATIAEGCRREHGDARVGVALDARLDEVYWGAFAVGAGGAMAPCADERVCAPAAVRLGDGGAAIDVAGGVAGDVTSPWRLAGAGAERYADTLGAALGLDPACVRPARLPNALDTLTLAWPVALAGALGPPESAVPVYLRERVALTEAERAVSPP